MKKIIYSGNWKIEKTLMERFQNNTTIKMEYLVKQKYVYVTGEMDPSGRFVSRGPNLTGDMEPGMKANIYTEYMKCKYVLFTSATFDFFTVILKMYFSVRTVLQSERVLNIFNLVISGMKTQLYT